MSEKVYKLSFQSTRFNNMYPRTSQEIFTESSRAYRNPAFENRSQKSFNNF